MMDDDWDHYLCRLGDDLGSIYLNLGLRTDAPIATHAQVTIVSVPLLHPTDRGMSSDAEFDTLISLEDDLNAAAAAEQSIYAGRLTARGSRVFYFYTADPAALSDAIGAAMARHVPYRFTITGQADPEWSLYLNLLFPGPDALQQIRDRRRSAAAEE